MEVFYVCLAIYFSVIITHAITRATIRMPFRDVMVKEIVRLPSEAIVFNNQLERIIYDDTSKEYCYLRTVEQLLNSIPQEMIEFYIEPKMYGIPSEVFTAKITILPPTKSNNYKNSLSFDSK